MIDLKKINNVRQQCFDNAASFIKIAKCASDGGEHHVAYHLAALAIEEIGKTEIIGICKTAEGRGEELEKFKKWMGDHEKKLFWAFFGHGFQKGTVTHQSKIEEYQRLAKDIHTNRLETLYVDPFVEKPKKISNKESRLLLNLAESRLEMEKGSKVTKLSKTEEDLRMWFMNASDDTYKRPLIFGVKSMKKLSELKDAIKWIEWMKTQFDENEKADRELLEKELKRVQPDQAEAHSPKWKVRIKIISSSHTIRPKILTDFSKRIDAFKLMSGQKKNELYADLYFPKIVPLLALWDRGYLGARWLLQALNIGTRGFFWYYIPVQTARYYEKIVDLEDKTETEVVIERSPILQIKWSEFGPLMLDEIALKNVLIVYGHIIRCWKKDELTPYDAYSTGLTLLSKLDMHFEVQSSAFKEFSSALKEAFKSYGDWDGKEPAKEIIIKYISAIREKHDVELEKLLDLDSQFQKGEHPPRVITLSDVYAMKIYCDIYFMRKAIEDIERQHAISSLSN